MKTTTTRFSFYAVLTYALCFLLLCFARSSHAAITATGDVSPDAPESWTSETKGHIGKTGDGTLDISAGGKVDCRYGSIGRSSGSTGAVTVDGDGSTWTSSRSLYIGYSGNGTLDVTAGGAVSNVGSGSNFNRDQGYIGYAPNSTGAVTVDGMGSTWTNGSELHIGYSGDGTLDISAGGKVDCRYGSISYSSGSTGAVTVDGDGSTWTNSSNLCVGRYGNGTLDITSGGRVSSSFGYIGLHSSSTGAVTVDGDSSTWTNSNSLKVGDEGNGTLDITSGGLVSVAGPLAIDFELDGDSFINMTTGGMLALKGDGAYSLGTFLGMIEGTDAVRYWDESTADWSHISNASYGEDYTLEYLTEGDLAGYTKLTVGVIPEPSSLTILLLGCLALLGARRRR